MKLTTKAPWYNREVGPGLTMDLAAGRCDILALNAFISAQVVGAADGTSVVSREIQPECAPGLVGEFLNWLGDDAHQVSSEAATSRVRVARSSPAPTCAVRRLLAADVSLRLCVLSTRPQFSTHPAILLPDETVELAFKCGLDFYMATTKRWIKVDVHANNQRGVVTYESVPLSTVPCFKVTTPAQNIFDQDAEIGLLTDAGDWGFDVRKGQGDIMSVYTLMNQKCVLGKLQQRL